MKALFSILDKDDFSSGEDSKKLADLITNRELTNIRDHMVNKMYKKSLKFAPAMEKNAAPITYKIRANNAYRLCANFLLSNKLYQDETGKYQTDAWKHNAGDMCFDRIALKSDNINTQTK